MRQSRLLGSHKLVKGERFLAILTAHVPISWNPSLGKSRLESQSKKRGDDKVPNERERERAALLR